MRRTLSLLVGPLLCLAMVVVTACSTGTQRDAPATALDPTPDQGQASPPSGPGITAEEDAGLLSGPPGTVEVTHGPEGHLVQWSGTRDDQITGYRVYRRCDPGKWVEVGLVETRDEDERNEGVYGFEEQFAADCEYTVAAVGRNGVTGPKSVEIQ